jgi:tetratricopeptide (TPR) repeat protein
MMAKNEKRFQLYSAARLAVAGKRWGEAEAKLRELIAQTLQSPFRGAADPSGRALETQLGDVLMAAKRPREAAAAYAEALRITPADSLALLGAARAARALGDEAAAAAHYRKLRVQWEHADAGVPDLAEVRAGAELGMR